jgi:hypothetical protein
MNLTYNTMKKFFVIILALASLVSNAQKKSTGGAPKSLSYTTPNVFPTGLAITPLTPTSTGGTITAYSVTPVLPTGLVLNATTGVISGTPTTAKAQTTYTVTGSNGFGSRTAAVVITVNAPATTSTTTTGTTTTTTTNTSSASLATVNYTTSTANIANPERGLYKHTETHSTGYYPLSQSALTGYRTNSNITLILRVFYLENFVNAPISSTYLSNMQTDFARLRAAGLKCVVRFAYADHDDPGLPHDAPKSVILSHIQQLAPVLQSNSDVIAVMQAGFIGSWGEWYYTDHFGRPPTATDYANRKEVVDALLAAVPGKMIQIRTPSLKMNTYQSNTALTDAQGFSGTNLARLGHHNDCFLASSSDYGTYKNVSTEYPYLEQETKYTAMGGETCAVNVPRSQCATAMSEMAKFHWSYLNVDYHATVIAGFQTENCFPEIQKRLGYRFELVSGSYPTSAAPGALIPVTMNIKNSGFATPYNARTPFVVFRNTATQAEVRVALNADPRRWTFGQTTAVSSQVALPAGIPQGTYKMFLHLPDASSSLSTRPEYAIRMANNNVWEATTGYNDLNHTITVGSATAREVAALKMDTETTTLKMYPVPANNTLTIEMDGLTQQTVSVYNTLGQRMAVETALQSDTQLSLNTQNLSNGVYIVSVGTGKSVQSRRVIVSH